MRGKTNYSGTPRRIIRSNKIPGIMAPRIYTPPLPFSPCLFSRFACMMNSPVLYSNRRAAISTLRDSACAGISGRCADSPATLRDIQARTVILVHPASRPPRLASSRLVFKVTSRETHLLWIKFVPHCPRRDRRVDSSQASSDFPIIIIIIINKRRCRGGVRAVRSVHRLEDLFYASRQCRDVGCNQLRASPALN